MQKPSQTIIDKYFLNGKYKPYRSEIRKQEIKSVPTNTSLLTPAQRFNSLFKNP